MCKPTTYMNKYFSFQCISYLYIRMCLGSKYYHMTSFVETKVEGLLNDPVFLRQVACSELYTQLT